VNERSRPRSIGESVRALRAAVEPPTLLAAVQGRWAAAVGERIAAESWPVREREGLVTVECRKATWAQELDLMQGDLLERVNQALGEARVRGLRFVVGSSAHPGAQ